MLDLRRCCYLFCCITGMQMMNVLVSPAYAVSRYLSSEIHTLQVVANNDFLRPPVITLGGAESISIDFDYLLDEERTIQYRVVHCNSVWEEDELSEFDYIEGFLPAVVNDVSPSYNTYVNYWHYRVSFPNEDVQLRASGNYAVHFYDDDRIIATATFSVSEQMAFVSGSVSANTDIDYLSEHQQLQLECSWSDKRLPLLNPADNMWHVVTQNHQPETRRELRHPMRMESGKAWYEHDRNLIFDAGNTWRRFEFVYRTGQTFGVQQVWLDEPYYRVLLNLDESRIGMPYRYDQDQHGRYKIRARNVEDVDTESEYFVAEFRLDPDNLGRLTKEQWQSGQKSQRPVFLIGDFTEGKPAEDFIMQHDIETGILTCRVLLKQGHYNYRYSVGEGNCPETQNEYEVYTWYRGPQDRYDRLLGVAVIR